MSEEPVNDPQLVDPEPMRQYAIIALMASVEYDNDLPLWWLAVFFITLIWGVLYLGYYFASSRRSESRSI